MHRFEKTDKRLTARCMMLLLGVIILVTACRKSDFSHENQYNRSYRAWLDFKKSSLDSYVYRVNSGSWTGVSTETTITVKSGTVVQRDYARKNIDRATSQPVTEESWSESRDSLNAHAYGASPLTLDAVYEKARTEWLVNREGAKISFATDNAGMISSCGYTENGCVDDCFRGIYISYIGAM